MLVLQARKPSKRKGLTASQWLYSEYVSAKAKRNWRHMKSAKWGIICVCRKACGNLRPLWSPPPQPEGVIVKHRYATFFFDARRDRLEFAERFVEGELKRGMTATEARFIGRRCRLRLIDEIRLDTRRERDFGRKSNEEYEAALEKVKHLPGDKLWRHIRMHCPTWRDATNAAIARDWYCSEGWIRKLRIKSAASLWALAQNNEQRKALEVLRLKPKRAVP
jgi:hypothetical protein